MWSSCLRIDRSALVRVLSMDNRHKRGRKQGDQLGGYCSPAGGIRRRKEVSGILDIFLRLSKQDLLKGGMCDKKGVEDK